MIVLSTDQAARVINVSHMTIYRSVKNGELLAQRVGKHRSIRITIDDLREYARKYNYSINEQLLKGD